jgi:hypothetical protein
MIDQSKIDMIINRKRKEPETRHGYKTSYEKLDGTFEDFEVSVIGDGVKSCHCYYVNTYSFLELLARVTSHNRLNSAVAECKTTICLPSLGDFIFKKLITATDTIIHVETDETDELIIVRVQNDTFRKLLQGSQNELS